MNGSSDLHHGAAGAWRLYPVEEFETLKQAWDNVNSKGWNTPLLDSLFVAPLIREFASGREVICVCGEIDRPSAVEILVQKGPGVWQSFQPEQAPLGLMVSQPSFPREAVVRQLFRALSGFPILIGLMQQDPALLSRPANSGRVRTLDHIPTPRILTQGKFDEYWAARPKSFRKNIRRHRNRLKHEGIEPRLELVVDPDAIGRAVDDFGSIESKGWKGQIKTAIHATNAQGRCYRAILEGFAQRSEGRVYQYYYGDRLVASDLCIVRDHVLYILKTTYDEAAKATSPTQLMRQEVFEQLFGSDEIQRIESYGRARAWHKASSAEIRTLYHVNCYRWSLLARVGGLARLRRRPLTRPRLPWGARVAPKEAPPRS